MFRSFVFGLCAVVGVSLGAFALTGSGDSPVGALSTTPPVFSGLVATPAEAASGDTVSIAFESSKSLDTDPTVTVNGNPAVVASGVKTTNFSYTYVVDPSDALGAASISINGADPLGNFGALNDNSALEIVEPAAAVPVRSWPFAVVLLLTGLAALTLRRRRAALGAMLLLLAAPAALAQGPTVSNVAFTQQPTGTGTEVIITYDLASPNGPSDITVSLSKDGGSDGFSFPVTSVTGDLAGVTTGTGKAITWDIAADYPGEEIPSAQLRVTADDGLALYTLTYTAGPGGSISGDASQDVVEGNDGTAVTAVPDSGFAFVDWTDSSTDNPRTDTNVMADLSVTANFQAQLEEMISVPAGSFDMGRTNAGDDATFGNSDELPVHAVTLSAYEIGKFEVTNQQVCDVYNWADDQGFFTTVNGNTAQAFGEELLDLDDGDNHIEYVGGAFQPETRTGLPGTTSYSMGDHPVQEISWFGAVAFCNWLSQIEGLTPVYNTGTWAANFANDGYHLPTEAQWERAAAWDGSKHWIYSFTSDTLTGKNRANYYDNNPDYVNPLGLTSFPYTTPVGWFDGSNVSPNGTVSTTNSVSPIGAYDMSGNVWEWCHDWYDSGYYATGAAAGPDPEGPASGSNRVVRGGGWFSFADFGRSAFRRDFTPSYSNSDLGFRLARTVEYSLSYSAGPGGTLTGDTDQVILPGDDGTTVEAVPDSGFFFVDWSDGVTDNPRTDTIVSGGINVTANFIDVPEMISISAGSFDMGRTNLGDDATFGGSDELPVHSVALSAYEIGKFEVTNQQVCDVFNWADDQGFFTTVNANTATAFGQELLDLDASGSAIEYVGGIFQPETRTGDPGASTVYSMADHPVQEISWFGAVAFCNWLSQMEGLTPVYNTSTWTANFANDGYHLPTEAQWERAAAWDGSKHWIYSFTSDTLTGKNRANYYDNNPDRVNPLGLTSLPYTTPVGWFDGSNVSPNGSVATVDSVSPFGAYDMSGNVWEWCHDWYDGSYYGTGAAAGPDPEGPASGSSRVVRGGSWNTNFGNCRSAQRGVVTPGNTNLIIGFRVARTP